MTRDTPPASDPVTGPRKRNLTEKAKLAAESRPQKKARNVAGSQATAGKSTQNTATATKSSATTRKHTPVSIEDVEDEHDLRRSLSPHNPAHVIEGPDGHDNEDDVIEVIDDTPEEPAESAESELSESNTFA
jgi:hypothetical protein